MKKSVNSIEENINKIYGDIEIDQCPFTKKEILELDKNREILIYLPANISVKNLCKKFEIKSNINLDNEKMIKNVMTKENQWFITSSNKNPEMLYKSSQYAKRVYENEGLYGMDFRRYLSFIGFFKHKFKKLPDQSYWTFLLSGSYDISGISIVGFDKNNILSHHGWMKDFRAKFCGSRYIALPPRIEITEETEGLSRAYRGIKSQESKEAFVNGSNLY